MNLLMNLKNKNESDMLINPDTINRTQRADCASFQQAHLDPDEAAVEV